MRTREIEIGDKVHHRCWQSDYEVVAINNGYAWLRTKDASKGVLAALFNLSRIEPAAPQPKFRVGQRVKRPRPTGNVGVIVAVHSTETRYDVDWSDGKGILCPNVAESDLEAVPAICRTCGGKVADG